jgi:hypothetical protein
MRRKNVSREFHYGIYMDCTAYIRDEEIISREFPYGKYMA